MSIIAPGTAAPEFSLQREDGSRFTNADLAGKTVVLVFYPIAFSPVCTDQFQVYQEALGEITKDGAEIYGVSTDNSASQTAFREQLGVTHPDALGLRAQGRGRPRARRLLRARPASRTAR